MRPLLRLSLLVLAALASPPAAAQEEVHLDPEAWRRLNVFFSNFAEAPIPSYRQGEMTAASLARFGVMHHVVNAPQRIEADPRRPGYRRLRASHVAAAVAKYFGVPLARHPSLVSEYPRIEYAGGYYVFPTPDHDPRTPFAQVARLLDVGGGEFVATVNLYVTLDGGEEVYSTPVEELGLEGTGYGQMRARVRRVREGGRDRYILLEWLPTH